MPTISTCNVDASIRITIAIGFGHSKLTQANYLERTTFTGCGHTIVYLTSEPVAVYFLNLQEAAVSMPYFHLRVACASSAHAAAQEASLD